MANFFTNIIDKVKGFFNIGSLNVELIAPKEHSRKESKIDGKVVITAKKDVKIKKVTFKFDEVWQKGRPGSDGYVLKTFHLGEMERNEEFELKLGETKEIEFSLPYRLVENLNDQMKRQGGAMGALGKVGSFLSSESSTFWLASLVETEGSSFPVTTSEKVKMN